MNTPEKENELTQKDTTSTLEAAAEKFSAELKNHFDVKEVIYLVAFEDEELDTVRLAFGSTEEAPEAVRNIMLTEALKRKGK